MKNIESIDQLNVSSLSNAELQEIRGGDEWVSYRDSQGYSWLYHYNNAGDLVSVTVTGSNCVM